MLEAHQAELGIDLNQYVYMNKNMNLYVDMLEVHTFQLEYEYENSKEGGGKKMKGMRKVMETSVDSLKVNKQIMKFQRNRVESNGEPQNFFELISIESILKPVVTDEQASYLEQVYSVEKDS